MREVTLIQYIVIAAMALVNFCVLILTFVDSMPRCFIFLTHWSYWASSIYLFVCCFCDSTIYFHYQSEKYEKLNEYFRNTYSIYCFSYGYSVLVLYWFLVCLGKEYMAISSDPRKLFQTIYLHGLITVMLLTDLVLTPRCIISWSIFDFGVISIAFVGYIIIALLATYPFETPPYAFITHSPFWILVLYAIGMYALHIAMYFLHISLVQVRNKCTFLIQVTQQQQQQQQSENKEVMVSNELK